jgi:hypothetical protein
MPQKKSSTSKTYKSKQAQWQRRAAAELGTTTTGAIVSATPVGVAENGADASPVGMGTDARETTSSAQPTKTPPSRVKSPVQAGVSKRPAVGAAATRGSARLRLASNQMSIEDEMSYVRSDIRRLIILTGLCLAVLILLAFVIR